MIKSLGNAMKKMAQRSMWRGNRDDAHAIESHGMLGVRANNQANIQSSNSTNSANTNTNNNSNHVVVSSASANIQNHHTTLKTDDKKDEDKQDDGLGGNIMGALQ